MPKHLRAQRLAAFAALKRATAQSACGVSVVLLAASLAWGLPPNLTKDEAKCMHMMSKATNKFTQSKAAILEGG